MTYTGVTTLSVDVKGTSLIQFVVCSIGLDVDSLLRVVSVNYETRRVYIEAQIVF